MKIISGRFLLFAIVLCAVSHAASFGQCSEFYGTTSEGGPYNSGTLYKTDNKGNLIYSFGFPALYEGSLPNGALMQASNGKIYGMTANGGVFNLGVLFEWDPVTGEYVKQFDFDGTEKGSHPYGSLIQADNNHLYGMTYEGGANNMGIIFEWNLSTKSFTKKLDFNGYENGKWPYGSLIQADNGKLYGMTYKGGSYDFGVLFEYDLNTNSYNKKLDFDTEKGICPYGSLIQADNGMLYGMTSGGGASYLGVLFEYDLSSGTYVKEVDFDNIEKGANPRGTLMQADNGKLYGTTNEGGIYGQEGGHGTFHRFGVLFEWDLITHVFTKKIDCSPDKTGINPCGALVQSEDGTFAGMTSGGGVFKWDPASGNCTIVKGYHYNPYQNVLYSSLLVTANHKMYGMFASGEKSLNGSLFEVDQESDTILYKFEFNDAINGSHPIGELSNGDDGKLYGVTANGGEENEGVIFAFDKLTKTLTKKTDFRDAATGLIPASGIIRAINGMYYGMTRYGGTYNKGVIYEWNPATNVITKKADLNDSIGTWANGSLVQAKNGKIYGTLQEGGTHNEGVLFELDPVSSVFKKLVDFDKIQTGQWPRGSLLTDNEKLFGVTSWGGSYNNGVLFEYDLLTNKLTKRYEFNQDFTGCSTPLVKSGNGKLYGVTSFGGREIVGVIYEFDPATNQCIKKLDLSDTQFSKRTEFPLMQASNGKLYGAFDYFNMFPAGTVMEFDPDSGNFSETVVFTGENQRAGGSLAEVFNNSSSSAISVAACGSYTSPSGKHIYNISGEYRDFIPNAAGCDSIITINLTVGHSSVSETVTRACSEFRSPSGKYVWKMNGIYTDTIPNAAGCDSIITISLEIDNVDNSVTQDRSVLISNDENAAHQWLNCDEGCTPMVGETHFTFTALKNGHYAVIVSNGDCVDTSAIYEVIGTGINDPKENLISIFPNPSPGTFTIDLGKVYAEALITITLSDGQVIRKEDVKSSREIEMEIDVPAGIYMVTIMAGGRETVFRVVKR
jgi:uncharacterized repeat protein (TIGR03803 family)